MRPVRVTQSRLDAYRAQVDAYGDAAATYVEEYVRALMAESPDLTVARVRDEAIEAIDEALSAFGDQASDLALDLFEEIVIDGHGLSPDTAIEDVIPREMVEGGVRYSARRLVEGESDAFVRDVADLSRYYVHRSAFENMERNCWRNDLRYARIPSGRETCAFCFMLSSRGFVYRSEETAGSTHAYHEHCDCAIVPGFEGIPASEQVEGYDPDGMRERWRACKDTVGTDGELRERWESMDGRQRSQYKGNNDYERYQRFVNAQVRHEVETRDWRWLYTGEVPSYRFEIDARPDEFERRCAEILRNNGFDVEFRRTAGDRPGGFRNRTSDIFIGTSPWEMKNPSGNGYLTVWNQFKSAVYGNDKRTPNPQSDRLVISNVRSERTVDQIVEDVRKVFDAGDFPEVSEVLIVGRDGTLRRFQRQ